jgi:hypothetical protein
MSGSATAGCCSCGPIRARRQEMVFDAHDRAFAFFKGTCTRGIYDNMKTAVETVFVGKERAIQPALPADVQPLSGRARRLHAGIGLGEGTGREPGRAGARTLLHAAAAGQELRRAERLAAGQVRGLCQGASASRVPRPDDLGGVRGRAANLVPYAGRFDGFHACPPRSSKTCLVRFDNNKYSVLATRRRPAGRGHAYADRIVIRQDGVDGRRASRAASAAARRSIDPWHYVPVLARKPGALRNGAPFKDWVLPAAMERSAAS